VDRRQYHPGKLLAFAAKILKEHLSMFINFEEEPVGLEEKSTDEPPTFNENSIGVSMNWSCRCGPPTV